MNTINVPHCYYCNGEELSPAIDGVSDHLGISPDSWRFLKCAACGSFILSPRPDNAQLEALYTPQYSQAAPDLQRRSFFPLRSLQYWLVYRWMHRTQAKLMLRLLKRRDGKGFRLLDIGCSNGFFLKEAVSLGFEGTGCDMRDSAITYVKNVLKLPAFRASAHDLSAHVKPGMFDIICAFHVVEHLPDPLQAIEHWFGLLKPGGSLIVGVPVIDSWQADILGRNWCAISEAPRHVSVPSRPGLKKILARAGFRDSLVRSDGLLVNAAALAHSLIPQCLQSAAPVRKTAIAQLSHAGYRAAGLLCTYLSLPLAFVESVLLRRPGQCISVAHKPL